MAHGAAPLRTVRLSLKPLPPRQAAGEQLGLPADGKVVAHVGRLTRIKRPDRLVAVARKVTAAMPGVTFAICGYGELGAKLSSAADLAQSVLRLLRDDRLRWQMSAAATSWTRERFGAERLVADVQRVYEAIALDRGWWPDFSGGQGPPHPQDAREVAL